MKVPLHPPGPTGLLSSFRTLRRLRADPPQCLLGLARQYGPVVSFVLLGRRFYFFTGPEAVREILVTHGRVMRKGFLLGRVWKQLLALMGNGLLTSEEPLHGKQRKLVVPAFHRERLAGYAKTMAGALEEFTALNFSPGATLDLYDELSELTLIIVARALFGTELGEHIATVRGALTSLAGITRRMRSPWWWKRRRAERDFDRARENLDRVVREIIAERRASGEVDRGDLLSMLLLARDEESGETGMTDTQIRDEVMTLLLAGHETTAGALAWTLHLLGENPEVQSRLQAEVDAVLPEGGLPGFDELPQLTYTRRVFTEAMRIFPPAWVLGRQTTEPVTIAGWHVPAGAMCLLSPFVTHRDPALYTDPGRFQPERWEAESDRPKYAYFPFGGGSRSCAGEAFAWMEGTLLLAGLVRQWHFDPDRGRIAPIPTAAVTLRPGGGVWLRLTKRSPTLPSTA